MTMNWSQDDSAEIARRYAAGQSATEIARAYGVTRNAVIGRLKRMGGLRKSARSAQPKVVLKPKGLPQEDDILNAWAALEPTSTICAVAGIDVNALRRIVAAANARGDARASMAVSDQRKNHNKYRAHSPIRPPSGNVGLPRAASGDSLNLTLMQLTRRDQCRYTADAYPPFRFCGHKTAGPDVSWCPAHRKIVYAKPAVAS